MSYIKSWKNRFANLFDVFGGDDSPESIGVYGPPNSGKTTLTNQILRDCTDADDEEDVLGSASEVPHETRKAHKQENITIEHNGEEISMSIIDTPGVDTQVDYEDFLDYDIDEDEAVDRSREATEGIAEAMHWLRGDVDGVIYMMDSTRDPFTQVNTMILGIIESQDIPALILANKIDLEESNVDRIRNAFPQYDVVPVSALHGDNMDEVYKAISENFG